MRYDVGRFRRPMRRSTEGQMMSLISLGDGSTLNLDFTTGQLDPRLTFDRLSTATFINSSGLVQYADHNLATNTVFANTGGITPTGWTLGTGTGTSGSNGTFVDGNEEWSQTATSGQRPYLTQTITIQAGLAYTCSVYVASVPSGTEARNIIWPLITAGSSQYYQDGVAITSTTVITPGRISVVFTQSSGSGVNFRVGLGCTNGTTVGTAVFSRPMLIKGDDVSKPYIASTTSPYQAPRFDHDPTTLAPRGLLIEAAATNLLNWSESFATSGGASNNWADTNITRNSTNNTDPANGTTALRVTASAGNGTIISTAAMGTSAQRTFSIWLRRVSGTGNIQYTLDNGSTYTTQAITSSWVRYTFAATTAAQRVGIRIVTSGDSIELWGAQLEAGSGASSYIPTGASQVQRLADNCVTAIGNLTGFDANQGTIYESWRDNTASDTTTVQEWAFAFGTSAAAGCGVFVSNAASGTFGLNGGVSNAGDAGPAGTYVIQGVNKAAIAINVATTSLRLSANGSAVSAGTNISGYNGAQTFALGQRNNNSRYLNGWIRQFKYWPYVLSDAQLQALTTL